jgi:hypothetical protein
VSEHIPLQEEHKVSTITLKENCTIFEMLFWDSWNL